MTATLKFQNNDQIDSSIIIQSDNILAILTFVYIPNLIKNKNSYIPQLTIIKDNILISVTKEFSIFENETLKKHFTYNFSNKVLVCGMYNEPNQLFAKYGQSLEPAFINELLPIISRY